MSALQVMRTFGDLCNVSLIKLLINKQGSGRSYVVSKRSSAIIVMNYDDRRRCDHYHHHQSRLISIILASSKEAEITGLVRYGDGLILGSSAGRHRMILSNGPATGRK